jgi:hypothetical protein
MLIQCPMCKGRKKVEGMGYMMHDCPKCNATGWVEGGVVEEAEIVEKGKLTSEERSAKMKAA